jgi:hypothetical protein
LNFIFTWPIIGEVLTPNIYGENKLLELKGKLPGACFPGKKVENMSVPQGISCILKQLR